MTYALRSGPELHFTSNKTTPHRQTKAVFRKQQIALRVVKRREFFSCVKYHPNEEENDDAIVLKVRHKLVNINLVFRKYTKFSVTSVQYIRSESCKNKPNVLALTVKLLSTFKCLQRSFACCYWKSRCPPCPSSVLRKMAWLFICCANQHLPFKCQSFEICAQQCMFQKLFSERKYGSHHKT